jgi:hypothetical protein
VGANGSIVLQKKENPLGLENREKKEEEEKIGV